MGYRTDQAVTEEGFELLSLIAIASEDGVYKFCDPRVMDMIFHQISSLPDGTKCYHQNPHLFHLYTVSLIHSSVILVRSSTNTQM
jgi:hypothetical protein